MRHRCDDVLLHCPSVLQMQASIIHSDFYLLVFNNGTLLTWSVSHKNILRLSWRQTLNGKISLFYLFLKMYLYFDLFNSFYSSLLSDRKKKLMESLHQRNDTQFSVSLCVLWAAKLLGDRIVLSFVTPHYCTAAFTGTCMMGKTIKNQTIFFSLCALCDWNCTEYLCMVRLVSSCAQ